MDTCIQKMGDSTKPITFLMKPQNTKKDCFQKIKKDGMHFRNRASKCGEKKGSDVVQEYYLRKAFQRIRKYRFLCCWH